MEHTAQKTGFPSAQEATEKYYSVASIRPTSHVPIHGGAIPIQQPPQVGFTWPLLIARFYVEHILELLVKSKTSIPSLSFLLPTVCLSFIYIYKLLIFEPESDIEQNILIGMF